MEKDFVTNDEIENFMDRCMKRFSSELKARQLEKEYLQNKELNPQEIIERAIKE